MKHSLFALFATTFLAGCSNNPLSQFSDLFTPSTSGTAVKVVKGTPQVYSPQDQSKHSAPKPVQTTVSNRRINTTECKDADDWYLDGYRVGKSFSSQKEQMLQQRMNFCKIPHLSAQFQQNWERGFAIGKRETGASPQHTNKATKANKAKKKKR